MKNDSAMNRLSKTILRTAAVAMLVLSVIGAGDLMASPTVIVDTTPTGATADGTVNPGEYVGSSTGINSGFGGQLSPGPLHFDSDSSGNLQIGLEFPWIQDMVTIYFDTTPGGVAGTDVLTDNADWYQGAISALGYYVNDGGDLFFAPEFEADYAMSIDYDGAELYEIATGTLVHAGTPTFGFSGGYDAYEIELPLTMMGMTAGASFDYVASLGSPWYGIGYSRSDEFHGVAASTVPPGNPGIASVYLASGDYNTFTTFAGSSGTIAASYTCTPNSGTLPFNTVMSVSLDNLYAGFTRTIDGRINLTLANGTSISNWRGGYTNVGAGSSYSSSWSQSIPALASVVGTNTFQLVAEDVTAAPYNQPPHPASGDTATVACTVIGYAP